MRERERERERKKERKRKPLRDRVYRTKVKTVAENIESRARETRKGITLRQERRREARLTDMDEVRVSEALRVGTGGRR